MEVNPPQNHSANADEPSRRQAWAHWVVAIIFIGYIWLPTADYFFHVDISEPPDENRLLASKPKLVQPTIAGVQKYLAGLEMYFNDHVGFRKRLIRWYQRWTHELFLNKSTNLVITGKDGWLYICERQMIDHYLGLAKFTPQQLQAWQRLLERRRDWLASQGIEYLFVIPPDKHEIYPEYLPAWLENGAATNRQVKLDQFFEYMKAHSTVPVLDLRPALAAGKRTAPTFLKNDTHWNFFGGFLAAQEIINLLRATVPELPPLQLNDFIWSNAPAMGGDLSGTLGLHPPEKNFYRFVPKPPLLSPQDTIITNIVRNWNPRDTNKVNHLVLNRNPLAKPVDAVIFNDSFAKPWWQFFGYSFHRCVFVWEDKEFNTRVILESHPRIVINEMLERIFNTEDPEEMMAKEAVPPAP